MTVLPVIARELRAAARHPFTYYLRVLGATALLVAFLIFLLDYGLQQNLGGRLFGTLHFTLFWAIWVLVPLLTADCISRERREGTLGLLFLTQLNARDIVLAKGLAHGLRALTLWLAVLPVVTIPFLLGGVGWREAVLSVLVNFNAICWALAVGLVASAWSKRWLRAMLRAVILAAISLLTLGIGVGWTVWSSLSPWWPGSRGPHLGEILLGGFVFAQAPSLWPRLLGLTSLRQLLWAMGELTALSVLALMAAVLLAGRRTGRTWQEEPPSQRRIWWQKKFFTPILWLRLFRRWMRWKLERNPIGWLEQRTWSGRLVTWAWLAVIISFYSAAFTHPGFYGGGDQLQYLMAWLLAGSIALTTAGSFRRERETGVMELLLVSPLGEREIIAGRLRGLWGQFLPAVGLLLGVWLYLSHLLPQDGDIVVIFFFAGTFLLLPVIGLYFSLCCRNFITAFLAILTVGLAVPLVVPALLSWLWWLFMNNPAFASYYPSYEWEFRPSVPAVVCQAAVAWFCWTRLRRRLKRRAFPLERVAA